MKKLLFAGLLILGFLMMSSPAQALTTKDFLGVIGNLQKEVSSLKIQLGALAFTSPYASTGATAGVIDTTAVNTSPVTGVTGLTFTNTQTASGDLTYGMTNNSSVSATQQKLKNLGYYTGIVDGNFGIGTFTALKNYQTAHGLLVTGAGTPETLSSISSAVATKNTTSSTSTSASVNPYGISGINTSVPNTTSATTNPYGISGINTSVPNTTPAPASGTGTTTATPTATNPYGISGITTTGTTPTPTFTYGVKNDTNVKAIQSDLATLGFTVTADGSFGPQTQNAVKTFQKNNGLTVNGVVDGNTYNAIVKAASNIDIIPVKTTWGILNISSAEFEQIKALKLPTCVHGMITKDCMYTDKDTGRSCAFFTDDYGQPWYVCEKGVIKPWTGNGTPFDDSTITSPTTTTTNTSTSPTANPNSANVVSLASNIFTDYATSLANSFSIMLNGHTNSSLGTTVVPYFEYNTDGKFAGSTNNTVSALFQKKDTVGSYYSATLSNILPNTTYYFRLSGDANGLKVSGLISAFKQKLDLQVATQKETTTAAANPPSSAGVSCISPMVWELPATAIYSSGATISATYTHTNYGTGYGMGPARLYFLYSQLLPDGTWGAWQKTPVRNITNKAGTVTESLIGLFPSTKYNYAGYIEYSARPCAGSNGPSDGPGSGNGLFTTTPPPSLTHP